MLTACDDKTVNIWSLEKQQFYKRLVGHTKNVTGVAVSPNTKFIVTCSLDKTVRLWNTMGEERFCFRPKGTEEAITCIVFSQEEKRNLIIAGCADGSIKIWSLDDIVQLHSLHGHTGTINAIALSPDGSLIASGGSDGRIQLWDLTECSHVYTIDVGSPVQSVCFSPANYWISVATETGIRIVHLEKKVNFSYIRIVGDQRPDNNEKPSKHLPWITSLNWSHDGTYLFAGSSDSNVYVFGVRPEAVY
uniref:Small ribosomal subunit protein RACK1 n=1 Tax=Dermatophagoides pteronyssinus TaxID=6956 RepID=A0A6P6Y553_DERPT|nr:guanine nucleotide-binding protein subunit beta-like protein [Dermatophagoides pteronyssinus]